MPSSYKGWTNETLDLFEEEIKNEFLAGNIRHPIHLSKGNSQNLINIFSENNIDDNCWCFCSHRAHFHALLKGIPKKWLKQQIMTGHSMHLMSKEYKFFASSIVGGSLPIAVGTALAIKRQGLNERVFAFLGDMAYESGIAHECIKYSRNFDLPIYFIVECNNLSTNSFTDECWGYKHRHGNIKGLEKWNNGCLLGYCYERQCEHINVSSWVEFK